MNWLRSAVLGWCVLAGSVSSAPALLFSDEEVRTILQHSPIPPPRPDPTNIVGDDPAAARLGQYLFFDKQFSGRGTVACADCHDPRRGWSNGQSLAHGIGTTRRHTPTLWNAAYGRWFFWDGRADTLWSQALAPLEDPNEHAGSRLQYAHFVNDTPDLKAAYEAIFGELPPLDDRRRFPRSGRPIPTDPAHPHQGGWATMQPADQQAVNRVFANLGKALAAFERRIVSRGAPFDVFAEGLKDHDPRKLHALTAAAQRGLKLFIGRANCRACHAGPNFTDGEFHDIGLPERGNAPPDVGRLNGVRLLLLDPFNALSVYSDDPTPARRATNFVVSQPDQQRQFKTPTLRNVAETAPYMHDGRFATLTETVRFYSTREQATPASHPGERILRPLRLSDEEIEDLAAFLRALTGEPLDADLTRPPASPLLPGTPRTVAAVARRQSANGADERAVLPTSRTADSSPQPRSSVLDLPMIEYASNAKAAVGGGCLAVTKPKTAQVLVFDVQSDSPRLLVALPFAQPNGVAIDGARHRVYVSDAERHRLHAFDLSRTAATGAAELSFLRAVGQRGSGPAQFNHPGALAVDVDGNLFVADFANARVQVFGPDLRFLRQFGQSGELHAPLSIALDRAGKTVYVLDAVDHRVHAFTREGQPLASWGSRWQSERDIGAWLFPSALAVAADGAVYVTDSGRSAVLKFDGSGRFVTSWGHVGHAQGELYKPTGIVTDDRGRVIVIDYGDNRAQIFDSNGTYVSRFFAHEG